MNCRSWVRALTLLPVSYFGLTKLRGQRVPILAKAKKKGDEEMSEKRMKKMTNRFEAFATLQEGF